MGKQVKAEHAPSHPYPGRLIVFEGLDGSGKSTQARRLVDRLTGAVLRREPTEGPVGTLLRSLLQGGVSVSEHVLARLFAADRQHHIEDTVLPALRAGKVVVCDRYVLSSLAYQATQGIPMDDIWRLNNLGRQVPRPDLTLYLKISPEQVLGRVAQRGLVKDRYENLETLRRVSENYRRARARLPDWHLVEVDAVGTPEEIGSRVADVVVKTLGIDTLT